jgi:hypothetical protein
LVSGASLQADADDKTDPGNVKLPHCDAQFVEDVLMAMFEVVEDGLNQSDLCVRKTTFLRCISRLASHDWLRSFWFGIADIFPDVLKTAFVTNEWFLACMFLHYEFHFMSCLRFQISAL